jgi:hypothetical protein
MWVFVELGISGNNKRWMRSKSGKQNDFVNTKTPKEK